MITIGHRGCAYAPENSLTALQQAIELGVAMIEFDVRLCATDEVVVMHDSTVNRTTNGFGKIRELSLDEIKLLQLKQKWRKQSYPPYFVKNVAIPCMRRDKTGRKNERIPTLEEALHLIDRKVAVNIELKEAGTAEPVSKIIKHYIQNKGWAYNDFLVSSFNHHELKDIKNLIPELRIAPLLYCLPLDYAACALALGAYSINMSAELVNQAFVDDAHARGLKVFVYVVNTYAEAQYMQQLGVDGIFTDRPDKVHIRP